MSASQQWTILFAGKRQQRRPVTADAQEGVEMPDTPVDIEGRDSNSILDVTCPTTEQQSPPPPPLSLLPPPSPTRALRERTYNKFRVDLDSYCAVYGSDGPQIHLEQIIKRAEEDVVLAKEDYANNNLVNALKVALEHAKEQCEVEKKRRVLVLQDKAQRGMTMHSVRAPGGRGVDGVRAIWTRSKHQCSPCVNDDVNDFRVSKEDRFKYVSINGNKVVLKKNPFDAEYLEIQERKASGRAAANRRRVEGDGVKGGRQASRLSRASVVGPEDVEYPTFVQQAARWSAADIGQCTMYDALMAHFATLTKQYGWQGEIRELTIEVVRRLQSRRDLIVSCETGSKIAYEGMPEEERSRRREAERWVVQLKIKLKKVAEMYAEASMTAGSDDEWDDVDESAGTKQLHALERSITILLRNRGACR
ncbi:hypothetical protein H2204_002520 [Knufia peltigerae]|uniref:Uncharacterized protein n=1 Tax=Knufia peltigerae TaxID=1002370 RepID=A0AA38YAW9_9EURO|nr:hypothetical protein H2204_002520 [Knufia peltigerae]